MKKFGILLLVLSLIMVMAVGCGQEEEAPVEEVEETTEETTEEVAEEEEEEEEAEGDFDTSEVIHVISREDGSGTRGAFTEITGLIEKDADDNEQDMTSPEAIIQKSTNAVMTTVSNDVYAIGYISLGSLNDTVKAVKVDGAEATADQVQSGDYPIARPFNLGYKELSPLAEDFLSFILSDQGAAIANEMGYVADEANAPAYESGSQEGTIVVAGSTSVTPLMEELAAAYMDIYPQVTIEIQSTGSSAGIQSAIEGVADLGMASRELKEEEEAELDKTVIAMDGIAVIVNNENPVEDISMDMIKDIFNGTQADWSFE